MTPYSVVLCSFNGARFISDQLRTIAEQDPPPQEIIAADDGSTDDTIAILREFQETAARQGISVRIIRNRARLGIAANFQSALLSAHTEIVFLSDQDDLWRPGRARAALSVFATDSECLLVCHDAQLIGADGRDLKSSTFQSMGLTEAEIDALNGRDAVLALCRRSALAGMAFALHARLLTLAMPIPGDWAHDYWLALVAAVFGGLRVRPDAQFLAYRQHDSNVVGAGSKLFRHRVSRLMSLPNDAVRRRETFGVAVSALASRAAPEEALDVLRRKAAFESARASLPSGGAARMRGVGRLLQRGGYRTYSSNGSWNALRDLIHPPEVSGTR